MGNNPQKSNSGGGGRFQFPVIYTMVVLILLKSFLLRLQSLRQWCIKVLLPWAQTFYADGTGAGGGATMSVSIFPPAYNTLCPMHEIGVLQSSSI